MLVTCILAQKHNLHILEGKVWFRDFIEYKCMQEMQTLMIFWSSWRLEMVVSERQQGVLYTFGNPIAMKTTECGGLLGTDKAVKLASYHCGTVGVEHTF